METLRLREGPLSAMEFLRPDRLGDATGFIVPLYDGCGLAVAVPLYVVGATAFLLEPPTSGFVLMADGPGLGLGRPSGGTSRPSASFEPGLVLFNRPCLCSRISFLLLNVSLGLCLMVPTAGAAACDALARAMISAYDPFFGAALGVSPTGVIGDAEFGFALLVPRYGTTNAEEEVARAGLRALNACVAVVDGETALGPVPPLSFGTLALDRDNPSSALRLRSEVELCSPGRALRRSRSFKEPLWEDPGLDD